ncbi:MAG: hypothetical protein LBH34_03150, partial [Prevotellaceae bacterium]|nr:hypothetical protein [Prevotellaceae bacterium]
MKQMLNMFLSKKAYLLTLLLLAIGMSLNAETLTVNKSLAVAKDSSISVKLNFSFTSCYTSNKYHYFNLKVTNDQNIGEVKDLMLDIPINDFLYDCFDVDSGNVVIYDDDSDTVKLNIPKLVVDGSVNLSLTLKFRNPGSEPKEDSIGVNVTGCSQPGFNTITNEITKADTTFTIYPYIKPKVNEEPGGCFPHEDTIIVANTKKIINYNWTNNQNSANDSTIYWCNPEMRNFVTIDYSNVASFKNISFPEETTYTAVNGTQQIKYSYVGTCGEPGEGDTLDVFFELDIQKHYKPELSNTTLPRLPLAHYDSCCNPVFEDVRSLKPKVLIPGSGGIEDTIQLNPGLSVTWNYIDLDSIITFHQDTVPVDSIYPLGLHTITFNFRYDSAPADSISSAFT